MKKQLQLFLSREDESAFTALLKESVPRVVFLNDNVWPGAPDTRESIEECTSGRVYLFEGPPELLPTARRRTGELEGPTSGCVVQVLRPLLKEGVLLSGRVAVGFDDGNYTMKLFASRVWKCTKQLGVLGVLRPDGSIDKHYLVGRHLIQQLKKGSARIADRATGLPYALVN
ncbi:MAG: hypothetical protein WCL11_27655 [Verrucomicrobiota bacterium]